jgi:drug/metabolite transporter (DMT)-like permease
MGSFGRVRRATTADLMLLTTVTLWALNFTVSKYILNQGFQPLAYSSTRYVCAGLVFAAITLPRERSFRIARADFPLIATAVGVLLANQLCFIYALHFTTATTVALLFGTLPIFTALISRLAGVERLTRRFWIAAFVSFAGVVLVTWGSGGSLSGDFKGDLLALGGAATWGGYAVLIAPLMARYSAFRISAVTLLSISLALLVLGAPQLADQHFDFNALVWIGFAFAVLGPLVTTNLLWFTAIDRVGPSHAAVFANLQPFLAAICAFVLLSEHVTVLELVGGVVIGAGIVIARSAKASPVLVVDPPLEPAEHAEPTLARSSQG